MAHYEATPTTGAKAANVAWSPEEDAHLRRLCIDSDDAVPESNNAASTWPGVAKALLDAGHGPLGGRGPGAVRIRWEYTLKKTLPESPRVDAGALDRRESTPRYSNVGDASPASASPGSTGAQWSMEDDALLRSCEEDCRTGVTPSKAGFESVCEMYNKRKRPVSHRHRHNSISRDISLTDCLSSQDQRVRTASGVLNRHYVRAVAHKRVFLSADFY